MGSPHDDLRAIANSLACSGESYYVEFKTAWDYRPEGRAPRDPKEIAADIGKTLVAFANADGGDLLIGVEDNGSVTGIPHAEAHLDYLKSWRQQLRADDGAEPSVRVAELELQGQRILLFRVEPTGGPPVVTADGRCLIRQKAASVPVPPAFIERRRAHISGDQAYEAEPVPGASISDLDWELIRAALAAANAPLQAFDEAALLRYWNLIEQRNGAITLRRAALLLFAREPLRWHPNNRLRVRHVHGQAPGFGRDLNTRERDVLGPILRVLTDASAALHLDLEREARGDSLFAVGQLLPREAVDECLVNAVVHRNYAIVGQAVEVLLYPDRVEFKSPGRLPDTITLKDLAQQRGVHRARNPVMMRVLRDLGWTRDQGEGIPRIFGSMRQVELHEPEFEEFADTFIVRLSTRSLYDPETQAWLSAYGPYGLKPAGRRYLVALRRASGQCSIDKLARRLGEPFDRVKAALAELERSGLVWHRPKSRSFRLVEPLNVPHERALQALGAARTLSHATTLNLDDLTPLVSDPRAARDLIERWRQAGILTPVGTKQWRLGPSFLAYLDQRAPTASEDKPS